MRTLALLGIGISAQLTCANAELVKLTWDYPTNALEGVQFRLIMATVVDPRPPLPTNWILLHETTNLTVTLDMIPGEYFFAVSASNYWSRKESPLSNIVKTPPALVTNFTITIGKP